MTWQTLNPFSGWQALTRNPVYLREKGEWGQPNPYYETLRRYSPLVVIGAIILGMCNIFNTPAFLGNNDEIFAVWCFICLPGILLSALTLFGSLMAPALTAPAISLERDRGTWDTLRVTPYSMTTILTAKLFGSLARLRILWWLLFVMSMFQGAILACSMTLLGGPLALWGWLLGFTAVARPWLEVLFAAFTGLYLSTQIRSATIALAGSYTAILILKFGNSSAGWALLTTALQKEDLVFILSTLGPTAVYLLALIALWILLIRRAKQLEYHG